MLTCDYCGTGNEASATLCRECGLELARTASALAEPETPPELPTPQFIRPSEVVGAFSVADRFHRADWKHIRRWIEANVAAPDHEAAWNEAALHWVTRLRDDLGGDYHVLQSHQTILLSSQPLETGRRLLASAGRAADKIKEHLGEVAWSGAVGRDVILLFSDPDDYYQYLAHHSPDGEQAASAGVCIHSGYTHIALWWHDETEATRVVAHELSHDCVAHLPLPLWLNEGVAVTLEKAIAPPPRDFTAGDQGTFFAAAIQWQPPVMWDELAGQHFSFWNADRLQSFWAGTSFSEPGDPSQLSYSLAEVLVRLLAERCDRPRLRAFLQAAHRDDAGQEAAMEILGADLGAVAAMFLGPGDWRPQRQAMMACWKAAGWMNDPDPSPAQIRHRPDQGVRQLRT